MHPMLFFAAMMGIWLGMIDLGLAQEHTGHPPEDMAIHEQFYSTWMMPNGGEPRTNSCCNNQDCYPTQFKKIRGTWYALRREDGSWMPIPESKLEHLQPDPRESPDGRSHVCASPVYPNVYCAVVGQGT